MVAGKKRDQKVVSAPELPKRMTADEDREIRRSHVLHPAEAVSGHARFCEDVLSERIGQDQPFALQGPTRIGCVVRSGYLVEAIGDRL